MGKKTIEWLSIIQYAKLKGVSEDAIRRHVKKGNITTRKDPKTGFHKINPNVADAQFEQHVRPNCYTKVVKEKPSENPDVDITATDININALTMAECTKRKEYFKAEKERLDYEERKGLLVEAVKVAEVIEKEYTYVRQKLLSIPTKLAKDLVVESDPNIIKAKIEDAINEVLVELSNE